MRGLNGERSSISDGNSLATFDSCGVAFKGEHLFPREGKIAVGSVLVLAGIVTIIEWGSSVLIVLEGLLGWTLLIGGGWMLASELNLDWTALRKRVLLQLRSIGQPGQASTFDPVRKCPRCSTTAGHEGRFCVQCGAPLV